jgi:glycosyltransferase involved in cell wall biosynthesis
MKLLIFCPYYPPHIGGLESHADEFNKHLSAKGASITVFTPRLPIDAPEEETKHSNVQVIRFPAFEIIYNYPIPKFWNPKFWRLFIPLFKKKYDIVISRTRFFNTSLWALLYAKLTRTKWVHIEHGSDYVKLDSKWKSTIAKWYDHIFGRLVLRWSDMNIANSQASAKFVQLFCHDKVCEVIYRGVDIEKILATKPDVSIRQRYPDKTIIAYLGRLIDGKGVQDVIRAVGQMENDTIVFFIVGEGGYRMTLEKLTQKLGIEDKVVFWGHKNIDEAIAILKTADICINPSYTEGLPTSVIEAALCQKAIIATNVGGTPEIIEDDKSGFLIPPKDIATLIAKIDTLEAAQQLRHEFGQAAFRSVHDKFNWNCSSARYWDLFHKDSN